MSFSQTQVLGSTRTLSVVKCLGRGLESLTRLYPRPRLMLQGPLGCHRVPLFSGPSDAAVAGQHPISPEPREKAGKKLASLSFHSCSWSSKCLFPNLWGWGGIVTRQMGRRHRTGQRLFQVILCHTLSHRNLDPDRVKTEEGPSNQLSFLCRLAPPLPTRRMPP